MRSLSFFGHTDFLARGEILNPRMRTRCKETKCLCDRPPTGGIISVINTSGIDEGLGIRHTEELVDFVFLNGRDVQTEGNSRRRQDCRPRTIRPNQHQSKKYRSIFLHNSKNYRIFAA